MRRPTPAPSVAAFVLVGCGGLLAPTPVQGVQVQAPSDPPLVEFRVAHEEPPPPESEIEVVRLEGPAGAFYVETRAVVSDPDFRSVRILVDSVDLFVRLELTDGGAARLAAATQENVGRRMAVFLDSRMVQTPVIRSPLGTPTGMVGASLEDLPQGFADRFAGLVAKRWPD